MSKATDKLKAKLIVAGKEIKAKTKVKSSGIKDSEIIKVALQMGKDFGYITEK